MVWGVYICLKFHHNIYSPIGDGRFCWENTQREEIEDEGIDLSLKFNNLNLLAIIT